MTPPKHILQFVVAGLLLACAPFNQLAQFGSHGPAVATGVALVDAGDFSVLSAYQNLNMLPGFRLQSEHISANGTVIVTREQDAAGNSHTINQTSDGLLYENYTIDGQTYLFNTHYNGWVASSAAGLALEGPQQWLLQLGVVPVKAGQETLEARSVTRYRLNYLLPKLTEAQKLTDLPKISGTIWVDDATQALLKSEIQLNEGSQARQQFTLAVTAIGQIAPIQSPTPIIDPVGIVAATATAQAWSALPASLKYQGQPVEFELVPVEVSQQADGATAALQLVLRNLPPHLLQPPEPTPFLTQLGARLQLSIPQNNLTAAVTNFEVKDTDPASQSITVNYLFKADLAEFSHVELILANAGNPAFAPVPVAGR